MIGIPISGPLYIHGDKTLVLQKTSKPESALRKESNSICYYSVHELVTMGESLIGHAPSSENFADLMTKVLYGQRTKYLVSNIL